MRTLNFLYFWEYSKLSNVFTLLYTVLKKAILINNEIPKHNKSKSYFETKPIFC